MEGRTSDRKGGLGGGCGQEWGALSRTLVPALDKSHSLRYGNNNQVNVTEFNVTEFVSDSTMIKRIKLLKDLGRFRALRAHQGESGTFSRLNVIYAPNATGKSTLSDLLRSLSTQDARYLSGRRRISATDLPEIILELEDGGTESIARFQGGSWTFTGVPPQVYVFDERFLADNVLVGHQIGVAQRRNLYSFAIGHSGLELQEKVNIAERELGEAHQRLKLKELTLKGLIPEGLDVERFRTLRAVDGLEEEIAKASDDLDTWRIKQRKAESLKQRKDLEAIPVSEIPKELDTALSATLAEAALAAESRIREHLELHSNGGTIEWLGTGYRTQVEHSCPYCGQSLQGVEIVKAYQSYFLGELAAQDKERELVRDKIRASFGQSARYRVREVLISHETERSWWNDTVGTTFDLPSLRSITAIDEQMKAVHGALMSALKTKADTPGVAIALSPQQRALVAEWEDFQAEVKRYNDDLVELNRTLAKSKETSNTVDLPSLEERVKQLSATRSRYSSSVVDAFADFDAATADKRERETAKAEANDNLRRQSLEVFQAYGNRINELLEDFSVDFRIVNRGVSFKGGQPSGAIAIEMRGTEVSSAAEDVINPAKLSLSNTLSGGDRSALGLAFFLAVVELDPELCDRIVVFDDPFHRQDRSRQRRTIEKVQWIAERARQCIVMSHDLDFAKAAAYCPKIGTHTFQLDPITEEATLSRCDLPLLPSQAYEKHYRCVTEFIQSPEAYLDRLDYVANTLRPVLEEYLRHKYPLAWGVRDSLGEMIAKVRQSDERQPIHKLISKLDTLARINEFATTYHHGGTGSESDCPDPKELLSFTVETLEFLHD